MEMDTPVLNVEEEYISTLHTRSNARFFAGKQQSIGRESMEARFDPQQQDVVPADVQRMIHRRTSSEIELAMAGYFDASDEASEICRQLLVNIKNAQSNYLSMDSFLASISDSVAVAAAAYAGADATTSRLALKPFAARSNPFSAATRSNFRRIHDRYSSILHAIKSSHGKVARKLRLARAVKKPPRRARGGGAVPHGAEAEGDVGPGRDLDTVSHLVARLSDGIERENAMAWCCAERVADGGGGGRFPVQEMVNELRRSCSSSRKLAEELEEHVCLCLATIHRARVLVIREISKQA
uniref:Uncharacterized protein n=1 Tax=Oryza brachyantha TaxID=4533 RepID=J3LXU8_ORYBR